MSIIDFRCRPAVQEVVSIEGNKVFNSLLKMFNYEPKTFSVEEMIKEMERFNVEKGVFAGRDLETTFGWCLNNDIVASVVSKYPDRFVGFIGVDPNKGLLAIEEIERCSKITGMKGLAMDPYMHKKPLDDSIYYPIYKKCCELGLPVLLTTGPGARIPETLISDAAPTRIDKVARDFPELVIVASHGCWPWFYEMIAVAWRHANVYFEFSLYESLPGAEEYVRAANTIIPDKVLFASAMPFRTLEQAVETYNNLGLTEKVRKMVMYENAKRILRLS